MEDTPITRVTINQMDVDALDAMLTAIRERRLERVRKLEAIAQVKASETQFIAFLKFDRQYKRAQRAMTKLLEMENKVEAIVHKARLLAMECGG